MPALQRNSSSWASPSIWFARKPRTHERMCLGASAQPRTPFAQAHCQQSAGRRLQDGICATCPRRPFCGIWQQVKMLACMHPDMYNG